MGHGRGRDDRFATRASVSLLTPDAAALDKAHSSGPRRATRSLNPGKEQSELGWFALSRVVHCDSVGQGSLHARLAARLFRKGSGVPSAQAFVVGFAL